jgi:hypothetical protein
MINLRKLITILILLSTTFVFAQQSKRVFDSHNTRDTIYLNKTGIVEHYSNCRSEAEDSISYQKFLQGLQPINIQLAGFIGQKKFDFKTKDSVVTLIHKYYVNSKGEIEYCTFFAHSKLSKRTTRRYAQLLEEFIEGRKVNYESKTPFFICGGSSFRLKQK